MGLRYDFDIVQTGDGTTAHFRDPATVTALTDASEEVREFFEASGFDLTPFDSGAGENRYPARHEADRIEIIERLGDNLWKFDVRPGDLGGFDFGAFMAHLSEAKPIEMDYDAFDAGLPVQRLFQTFRRRRPSRILFPT